MAMAFPEADQQTRETIACDYFIDALGDADFGLKIRERAPKSLDAALLIAQQLEVWSKDADRPKLRNSECHERKNLRTVETNSDGTQFMSHIDQSLKQLENKIADHKRKENVSELSTQREAEAPKMAPKSDQPATSTSQLELRNRRVKFGATTVMRKDISHAIFHSHSGADDKPQLW
jgi:hypothetical protein